MAHQSPRRPPSDSSSEEMEDGFILIGDELTAEWDGDQTKWIRPTAYQSAVMTAKHTWGKVDLAKIQSGVSAVAAELANVALETVLSKPREGCLQDITAWDPDFKTFDSESEKPLRANKGVADGDDVAIAILKSSLSDIRGKAPRKKPTSAQIKLEAYRATLSEGQKQKDNGEAGLKFEEDSQSYDAMGLSGTWQRSPAKEEQQERRRKMLAEWNVKKERSLRERESCSKESAKGDAKVGEEPLKSASREALAGTRTSSFETDGWENATVTGRVTTPGEAKKGMNPTAGMERNAAFTVSVPSLEGLANRQTRAPFARETPHTRCAKIVTVKRGRGASNDIGFSSLRWKLDLEAQLF